MLILVGIYGLILVRVSCVGLDTEKEKKKKIYTSCTRSIVIYEIVKSYAAVSSSLSRSTLP